MYQCLLTHPSPPWASGLGPTEPPGASNGRWSLGVGRGAWGFPLWEVLRRDGHPPKSRPAHQTASGVMRMTRISMGVLFRCGCGKSVTGHHRQRGRPRYVVLFHGLRGCPAGPRARARQYTVLTCPSSPKCVPLVSLDEHTHLPLDLIHTRGPAEFKHIIKRRKRN